jgi:hypothetical protein
MTHTAFAGAQDTGTPAQSQPRATAWDTLLFHVSERSTGDGGVVAVDVNSEPKFGYRYSSSAGLERFRRQRIDAAGALVEEQERDLAGISPRFYTPIQINAVDGKRLVFGAGNGIWETLDRVETLTRIDGRFIANTNGIAYGADGNPIFSTSLIATKSLRGPRAADL